MGVVVHLQDLVDDHVHVDHERGRGGLGGGGGVGGYGRGLVELAVVTLNIKGERAT